MMQTLAVYLDTETNFGDNPVAPTTSQVGVHSPVLGLDLSLHNKRSAQRLWLDLFNILKNLGVNRVGAADNIRYVLIAHNGFAFDFMHMVSELSSGTPVTTSGSAPVVNDENDIAVMKWLSSSGQVCFIDSMELLIDSFQSRGIKSPRSFSLDSLYSTFIGCTSNAMIPSSGKNGSSSFIGRHDALEDARMLRLILERVGIEDKAFSSLPLLGWAELLVMHRCWRVREGLLKNPSRIAPTPRVFTVPSCVGSYSISLFKTNDAAAFTAMVAPANAGGQTHILSGNLAGRTQGIPARMRAWASILTSVGKRGTVRQTKQLLSADSEGSELYAEHPLLCTNSVWYKDPACILPDDVVHLKLIDPDTEKIVNSLQQLCNQQLEEEQQERSNDQKKFSVNFIDATNELMKALEALVRQGITYSWQKANTSECVSFI